jgi:hypothetical protein
MTGSKKSSIFNDVTNALGVEPSVPREGWQGENAMDC